ncbi:septal ring lytic transglycosylase RlpA family protein [Candidatus Magnetominusculus xianensis]|uniref:Probable endolytic peptidoglycan transglycosylase RlpA n=1 Tax=Candidatus Magnetominusculus xianensis TaxID=1748249 RepID=A0ABR5SDA9_9BACT|nr:septal ring lytic transglycosylase RlpA family protein [Candidatus Magnetominusculus xianensis]KWT79571.1 rare lipoprotein A [Candidatus Magnetominusculus xianensis]MBF0405627.1 septal ring lytic transglycosylase RlpA family protein [Nitrospirota bacterium]
MKQSTSLFNRSFMLIVVSSVVVLAVGLYAVPSEAKKTVAKNSLSKKYAAASWYGKEYHGRRTSSGVVYDMNSAQAAHKTLPFGTNLRVTNLRNGKSTKVKITDRGPFTKSRDIDLSYKSAKDIGIVSSGVAKVKIDYILKDGTKTQYVDISDLKTLPDRLDKIAFLDYKNAAIMKRMLPGSQRAFIKKSNVGGRPVYIVSTQNSVNSPNDKRLKDKEVLLTALKSKVEQTKTANKVALMLAYNVTPVKQIAGHSVPSTFIKSSDYFAGSARFHVRFRS